MILKYIKKFLKTEAEGLRRAFMRIIIRPIAGLGLQFSLAQEEITQKEHPEESKIIKEISEKSNLYPKKIFYVGSKFCNNGACNLIDGEIEIGRGFSDSKNGFSFIYAHELGHKKNKKFHAILTAVNFPYNALLHTTTSLYAVGFLGTLLPGGQENAVMDAANWIYQHTEKALVAGAINAGITIRIREFMADVFAHNNTNVLPTDAFYGSDGKQKGVIGNIAVVLSNITGSILSGYPTSFERNTVCKLLGNNKQNTSFVDKINSEKEIENMDNLNFHKR